MAYSISELASSGRAVCNVTDHKKQGIKIGKGELRMGAWVTFHDTGSWKWRHWGCVTPQVLENIKDTIDGDYELVDGMDELPEEMQDKIKRAIQQGHVDDEDWQHDPAMNTVGAKGFKSPATKKSKKNNDAEDDEAVEDGPKTPTKAGKKRSKAKADDDDDEEARPAKKSKARAKKQEPEAEDEDEAPEPTKKGRGKAKKDTKENASNKTTEAANTKKPRGRPKKESAEDDGASKEAPAKKPRGKKAKAKEASADIDETAEEPEVEPEEAPKVKKGRGRKAKA
ncbi:MAG: hypothetical protein Q9165_001169 [Trypethelium subeluteriae]